MQALTWDVFTRLARAVGGPRVSIYVPLGPPGDARGGLVRLDRELLAARQELQSAGLRPEEVEAWSAAAREAVADDPDLLAGGGLALFLSGGAPEAVRIADGTPTGVRLGPRYLLTPLAAALQGDGVFFILALSRHGLRLLRCTRTTVAPVHAPALRRTMDEVLGGETEPHDVQAHRYGGVAGGITVFHGHGGEPETIKDRTLRYFQALEPVVREALGHGDAPLILAGVDELFPVFRRASDYPHILRRGLAGSPAEVSDQWLHARALPLVALRFEQAAQNEADRFASLAGTGATSDDVAAIAARARQGLVDTLFLLRDTAVWGRYEPAADRCVVHDERQPWDEDLVNAALIDSHLTGGRIFARPVDGAAPGSALAAILRG